MTVLDFTTLIKNQISVIQAEIETLLDFTVGSVLRAILEANASLVVWLQNVALKTLALTRAATSSGSDLDSWMADYGLTRLPSVASSGEVTFARFTTGSRVTIPIGTLIQNFDGSQEFRVIADNSYPTYDSINQVYVLAIDGESITVPIENITVNSGALGNAPANSITVIVQTIPGIDTVTNANAFTNGRNEETDDEFRARFLEYIASLRHGTFAAIAFAIDNTQAGITHKLVENYNYDDSENKGFFYAVVDDGSGDPPDSLIDAISANIEATRPLCSTFELYKPVIINADVNMNITVASGDGTEEIAAVIAALTKYLNFCGLGNNGIYTRLADIAYGVSTNIVNVTPGYTLNGAEVDLEITSKQTIRARNIVVT